MVDQPGVRYGLSTALLVADLFISAAARLTGQETEVLTVVVAGLASCGLSLLLRASIGIVAWAMFTGFVVNRFGSLTFHHDDVRRLLLFPLATVVLAALARRTYLVIREKNAHE
jgi:hypothetical protein